MKRVHVRDPNEERIFTETIEKMQIQTNLFSREFGEKREISMKSKQLVN